MSSTTLELAADIDIARYRIEFDDHAQVQIAPFLTPTSAQALHAHLSARADWREIINSGDKVFELDRANQQKLSPGDRERLDAAIAAGARDGFQHRYEGIRVSDDPVERQASGTLLDQFAELMASAESLNMLKMVTGFEDIDFADAQATNYRGGDFLTGHRDDVEGKNRRAAYVFGLTSMWRLEWGGLLLFHDNDDLYVSRGLVPAFNCLNLFAVPQTHSVSQVASYAARERVSITGWLRVQS